MPRPFNVPPRRTSSRQKLLPPSMMTSSASMRLASASMVASVIFPAGSITQAVRGFASLATKSSSAFAPAAPSAARAATAFSSLSKTTVVWPSFIRRRTMLPPIRPKPIIPSCIFFVLTQRFGDRSIQHLQALFQIALQMHPQRAPAALGQDVEITAGLCRLDHAKACLLAGDSKILGIVGGDLQKHSGVGAALVGLTGRMQEARTEFGTGRGMARLAQLEPHRLQRLDMGGVALDIGEQRHVIVAMDAREMRLQP